MATKIVVIVVISDKLEISQSNKFRQIIFQKSRLMSQAVTTTSFKVSYYLSVEIVAAIQDNFLEAQQCDELKRWVGMSSYTMI